jgi:hypothetical protein
MRLKERSGRLSPAKRDESRQCWLGDLLHYMLADYSQRLHTGEWRRHGIDTTMQEARLIFGTGRPRLSGKLVGADANLEDLR